MNTSGEAADQVVRMMLNGTEVLLKLSGSGAKNAAVLLYSIARQQKKTRGAVRLESMIRSGKPMKIYAFEESDLSGFKEIAKQYGILYTVLKEKDKTGGVFDVMVRAEDESKMARITERFGLAKVDVADLRAEVVKEKTNREHESGEPEAPGAPGKDVPEKSPDEILAEEILEKSIQKEESTNANPIAARTEPSVLKESSEEMSEDLSGHSSGIANSEGKSEIRSEGRSDRRPSVRKRIEELKRQRADRTKAKAPSLEKVQVSKSKMR